MKKYFMLGVVIRHPLKTLIRSDQLPSASLSIPSAPPKL